MSFLLEFAGLTFLYVAAFSLLVGCYQWIGLKLAGQRGDDSSFLNVLGGAFGKPFGSTPGARHRRLEYLLAMMLITMFITVDHPGPPVVIEGAQESFSMASQSSAGKEAAKVWSFVWYGFYPPKAAAQKPTAKHSKPTWFWGGSFILYLLVVSIAFFVEFFDDVIRPALEGAKNQLREWREDHERREKEREQAAAAAAAAAAQAQRTGRKGKGQSAPPQPAPVPQPATAHRHWLDEVSGMTIVGLVMDVGFDILRRYFEKRRSA